MKLQDFQIRLENGEHILFNDYNGVLEKQTFSVFLTADKQGKYLQIVSVKGSIIDINTNTVKIIYPISSNTLLNIPNYTELSFLSEENIEEESDTLSQDKRKLSDYKEIMKHIRSCIRNIIPYSNYSKYIIAKMPKTSKNIEDLIVPQVGDTFQNYSLKV